MNLLRTLLVSAVALAAAQAHAVVDVPAYTYTFGAVPAGEYTAPSFTDGIKASVQSTSVVNMYLQPQGVKGDYLVVSSQGSSEGSARINTGDVKFYSFVWGSPDTYNTVDIFGLNGAMTSYTGSMLQSQFSMMANGANSATGLFTITGTGNNVIDHLVLKSSGVAFEVAAPVPEPETYALMLAGLGALGFMARRRNNA